MTFQPGAMLNTQGFGSRPENVEVPHIDTRNPTAQDSANFPVGKRWINTVANVEFTLTSMSTVGGSPSASWTTLGSAEGDLNTITTQDSTVVMPSAGNINISGSNGLTTTGSGNTVTIVPTAGGFPITPYVVGPSGKAGYQTVQSAVIAATNAGGGIVYIQPGTYTENVTMGVGIHLVADVGISGNTSLETDGGEVPSVSIIGNLTMDLTAAASVPTTVIKNILFSATSGNVISIIGNVSLLESGYIAFWGCWLQTNGASNVFHIDGFLNVNLIESFVTEVTPNTSNFFNFGVTPFLNLNCRDSVIDINGVNAIIIPDSSYLVFLLENCSYSARLDLSGGSSALQFTGTNLFIDFNAGTPGLPLFVYGSNTVNVIVQNCIITGASGALANGTGASSISSYTSCVFDNPLVIGSTGIGSFEYCTFEGGTNPAVTMSSSQGVSFTSCIFNSTNNPAIAGSGAGTVTLGDVTFINNSAISGSLTLAWVSTQLGASTITGATTIVGTTHINATGSATTTIGGSSGLLTIASGSGGITATGGGNTISLFADAAANLVTLGSTTGAASLTLQAGSGNINVAGAVGTQITVGNTAQTGTITLGSSSATNSMVIAGGSGATTLSIANVQHAGSVSIGAAMTTGTIALGGAQTTGTISIGGGVQTGTITVGGGTGAQTVNLATGATGVKTVHIADSAVANVVTLGSTTGAASTTIQAGSAGITMTGATSVTGSLTASTTLTATLGAITATNGNLVLGTAGNKILSTSVGTTTSAGANSFGSVTLVSGTATVATTAVTASSLIVLWRQSLGSTGAAAIGSLTVGTITAGTSFVINSATIASATTPVATDVSVVGWMIIN